MEAEAIPYERRLDQDLRWAMDEGDRFFGQESKVFLTLRDIVSRLDELKIPYALAGAMSMFAHGFRRFTEDVDLLVTREGLSTIHAALDGRGYARPFAGSKTLRNTEHGVKIDFLIAGDYPGDGKPKPVAFPDPSGVSERMGGVSVLKLPTLVEMKLASGMTNIGRTKDLGDVIELIKALKLPLEFSEKLNSYVSGKYVELWNGLASLPPEE